MSFRLKTILGIAAIEIVLLAGLIFSGFYYLKVSNETQLQNRARESSRLLATMVSDSVVSMDFATLDALIAQTLKNPDIVYVRVRHTNGSVMSEGGDRTALARMFRADTTIADTRDDKRFDVMQPITTAGKRFGQVEMGFSTAAIGTILTAAVRWMSGIAATEIALVALAGFLLGTMLTRQLEKLRVGAERVAAGEFGHQLAARGKDELAATSRAFNSMSVALARFASEAAMARELAEAGRDEAETVLADALDSMRPGVVIADRDGMVRFINGAYRRMYPDIAEVPVVGGAFAALAAVTARYVRADDGPESLSPAMERVVRFEDPVRFDQWQSRLTDGRVVMVTQKRMTKGGVVIVETDLTRLYEALDRNRKLEVEILQSQKMESLGTMAGGIAHEINTPTQYIGDNLQFLRDSFAAIQSALSDALAADGGGEKLAARLSEIEWPYLAEEIPKALTEGVDGVAQVSKIVRSVKAFCHPEDSEMSETDLPTLIDNVLTVSRSQWKYAAEVTCSFGAGAERVECYPGELSQVLINLIINAAQAIEDGNTGRPGNIRIETSATSDAIEIAVRDNGCGIPEENRARIFDLFFTTKPPGKGTGQGLALCQAMIEGKHKGKIAVESQTGVGTCFRVYLPHKGTPGRAPRAGSEAA